MTWTDHLSPMSGARPGPPPPPWYRRGMTWAIIGASTAFVAIVGFVVYFFSFLGDPGADYWVEQGSVLHAVDAPCAGMLDAADEIELFSTQSEGAAALAGFVTSGRAIVSAIDDVDADSDSVRWRNDWEALLDGVDDYAQQLADGDDAVYDEPTTKNGYSVIYRMSYASAANCEVPRIIAALDLTPPEEY